QKLQSMRLNLNTIRGISMSTLFIVLFAIKAIAVTATKKCSLPSILREASGIDYNGTDFWTHNDSGTNKIYRVNISGILKQTIVLTGASNRNWEDITHNSTRTTMFIGDFGNNNFDRTNLRIYKLPTPSSTATSVTPSTINFKYPDQKQFPSKWKNFDSEAFFHLNNKLYIFTKGEGSAIGYTKLYTVPDVAGTYTATLIDSFYVNSRITGAAISPDQKSVTLISNTKIFLFKNFTGSNIFNGASSIISITGSWTQKEGVSYRTGQSIYIVDEGAPGHLYSVDLSSYFSSTHRLEAPEENTNPESTKFNISAFPNPANFVVNIQPDEKFASIEVLVTNLSGQIVKREFFESPSEIVQIETEGLSQGIYAIRIIGDNRKESTLMLSVVH
ncbi:MAG: T9SS type A sorting domain-containing protein, partial [bacterium]